MKLLDDIDKLETMSLVIHTAYNKFDFEDDCENFIDVIDFLKR